MVRRGAVRRGANYTTRLFPTIDDYEGRYGVEDMRQAVTEARLQGVNPFCLTVDRLAANYLPGVFGAHHYALLPKPEPLPTVLLEWMKRLLTAS